MYLTVSSRHHGDRNALTGPRASKCKRCAGIHRLPIKPISGAADVYQAIAALRTFVHDVLETRMVVGARSSLQAVHLHGGM